MPGESQNKTEPQEVEPVATMSIVEAAPVDVGLLRASNAADMLAAAEAIATPLKAMIQEKGLFVKLGQGRHVRVEGWTTMLAMLGVTPVEKSAERIACEVCDPDGNAGFLGRGHLALSYDVNRGRLGNITPTNTVIDLGPVVCIEDDSPDASTTGSEDLELPEPGTVFFYLVGYHDGTTSTYGSESANLPRAPGPGSCGHD